MPILGSRILALMRRNHRVVKGWHKTVTLERIDYVATSSDYRPGATTVAMSILIEPAPIVRLVTEEDITEFGSKVSMADYIFEVVGDSVTEQNLLNATQLVINKGLPDEESMNLVQFRPGGTSDRLDVKDHLYIYGGKVIHWFLFARATKRAA